MASYLIEKDSLEVKGEKTVMNVTFKAEDGRSVTQYYEVDSTDTDKVKETLENAALDFEASGKTPASIPAIQTGKTVTVEPKA
jgi:hypothetical protein